MASSAKRRSQPRDAVLERVPALADDDDTILTSDVDDLRALATAADVHVELVLV